MEELLLITTSRYIVRLALESGRGKHRASFRRLAGTEDERGPRYVYEKLAGLPVETYVYGIPDWSPPAELHVTMHGGWSRDFCESWFVVFIPPTGRGRPRGPRSDRNLATVTGGVLDLRS